MTLLNCCIAKLLKVQKTRFSADSLTENSADAHSLGLSANILSQNSNNVKYVDLTGIEPANPDSSDLGVYQHQAHIKPAYQKLNKVATGFFHLRGVTQLLLGGVLLWLALFPTPAFATNTGVFTMELWVKPTSSVASQALVGKAEELRMFTDSSGNPGCQIKTTSWQTGVSGTSALTLNSWNHVACFYDKTNIKIYVNGVQTGSQALTTVPDDTANTFKIGQDDSASTPYSNLTGIVDQFQFYNYARSAKQITEDMLAGGDSLSNARGVSSSSPVGYWKFDEGVDNTCSGGINDVCNSGSGGSALDGAESGMSVPATSTSGWTQAGKFGKALIFDGTNDYVQVSDNSALDMSGGVAISAWINLGETPGASLRTILAKDGTWSGTSTNYQLDIRSSGKIEFAYRGSDSLANEYITNSVVITSGSTWYHVVLTYDGTNNPTIYVNGKAQAGAYSSGGNKAITGNAQPLFIGVLGNSGSPYTNYFIGTLDELKIYNYALTADEVKLEYNRSSSLVMGSLSDNSSYQVNAANQEYCIPGDSASCAAPVGRWDFEEGSGTSARDTSGNANNGTWNGTGYHSAPGHAGKAGKFNGSDDYIGLGQPSNLNFVGQTNAFTIAAWIKTAGSASSNMQIVAKADNSIGQYQLIVLTTGVIAAVVGDTSSQSTTTVNDNKWHHVAVTVPAASTGLQIYIDGKLESFSLGTGGIGTTTNAKDVLIGARRAASNSDSATLFPGQIDDVRIYNYARSAAQIAWDYNRGAPVGHWKMDECQGDRANDSSGNSNTGTITTTSTLGTCNTASTFWGGTSGTGAGKVNYAPTFNGTGDYIDAGGASSLNITTAITITAWIKTSNNTQAQTIIEKTNTANPWNGYAVNLGSNDSVVCGGYGYLSYWPGNYPTNSWVCSNSSNYNNGNWHHIAIVHSGTTVTFYKDAVSDGTATVGSRTNNSSTNLFIGQNSLSSRRFSGQIDDVRIYNYALTATQVKSLYNGGSVRFGPSTGSP